MAVKAKSLRRLLEAAQKDKTPDRFFSDLTEALESKQIEPKDFSIRECMEEFITDSDGAACGREILDSWNPRHGGGNEGVNLTKLVESDAVNTAFFSNIFGQIIYTETMAAYRNEDFTFTPMIPTVSTQFNGEKLPGVADLGDKAEVVDELGEYPIVGTNEDWVETPQTTKRGLIVPVSKEVAFFDRTGLVLERCRNVGYSLGLNKEKRAIDCVIDENTTRHRYNRKSRGQVATYGNNSGTHDWDNLEASNALVDWTDIDNLMQLFYSMRDPNTGEPIVIDGPMKLIVTRGLVTTANRIKSATEVVHVTPGYATSANPIETRGSNPVGGAFDVLTSRLLADRLATDTDYFMGDPSGAFRYMENWPMAVVQAPANSELEFSRDIPFRWKASERGQYVVREPRLMAKATVA